MSGDRAGLPRRASGYAVVFLLMVAAELVPVWTTRHPAMADYPNHLARAAILQSYEQVPAFRERYEPAPRLVPNLGFDLVMAALRPVASIEMAGRIFLTLVVVLFALGCHLVGAGFHGRPTWTAPVATWFTWNFFTSWGLLGYLLSLALFLLSLGLWLRLRRRASVLLWAAVAALSFLTYVAHLGGYGVLVISVAVLTAASVVSGSSRTRAGFSQTRQGPPERGATTAVLNAAAVAAPLVLLVPYLLASDSVPMAWWQPILLKKLVGLGYPFVAYGAVFDLVSGALLAALMAAWLWPTRGATVEAGGAAVAVVLLALYAVAPMEGGIESNYVDRRLLVPAAVVALLAMRPALNVGRAARVIVPLALGLWGVRMGHVTWSWWQIDRELTSQLRVFESLPDGARVFPVFLGDAGFRTWPNDMHFSHLANYATVTKHAFVPTLFANSAFPLRVKQRPPGPAEVRAATPAGEVDWDALLAHYDYLWTYKLGGAYQTAVEARATLAAEAGPSRLYRVMER